MALAWRQMYTSLEQEREPGNKPSPIWSIDFQQGGQD